MYVNKWLRDSIFIAKAITRRFVKSIFYYMLKNRIPYISITSCYHRQWHILMKKICLQTYLQLKEIPNIFNTFKRIINNYLVSNN